MLASTTGNKYCFVKFIRLQVPTTPLIDVNTLYKVLPWGHTSPKTLYFVHMTYFKNHDFFIW